MYEGTTFTHAPPPAASPGLGAGSGAGYGGQPEGLDVAETPDTEQGAARSYWRLAPFCLFVVALGAFALRRSQARRARIV